MAPITNRPRLRRCLIAFVVASASLPLALICVDSFFGLGSLLVVPTFVVGLGFALTACNPARRAWWFGFSVAAGFCLPLCPLVERRLFSIAHFLQDLSQKGTISLSQRVIEPTLLVLIVLLPFLAVGLAGVAAGRCMRRFAGYTRSSETSDSISRARWRLTIRELLVAIAAICLLLAWIGGQTRTWQAGERKNQRVFLSRFESSFKSGQLKLLAAPMIDEQQRTLIPESRYMSFQPPEVNEYRVIAPVEKNSQRRWAVWSYVCNGNHGDGIYCFAYAEAATREQLPSHPSPMVRYIQWSTEMLDGIPNTAGPSATIVSLTSSAAAGQPVTLVVKAALGTVCQVEVFPPDVLLSPIPAKSPDQKGKIEWTWRVNPKYAGQSFAVAVKCKEPHGSYELVNSTKAPNVQVTRAIGR